ncbi:MAG TPA: 50S ribosomal protein L11 methyltransferase [Alphaproteobacteria bacterium]|nr:50S ribosomal protein L11 methyltransferase [Alphaproteobacteria bacterium]
MPDAKEIAAFIPAQTAPGAATIVPEIKLYLATEVTPIWHLAEQRLKGNDPLPPPYWAFAWPGGQGLARYMLDHPDTVCGKRVLDFAAGCGIAAIASMKAGAERVLAADIDPFAQVAIGLNAELNGVTVDLAALDFEKPFTRADVILAGDVCYQQAMSAVTLRWLYLCITKGVRVLLADPGRAYVPDSGLVKLASYDVPVSRDLEDRDSRTVTIWDVGLPESAN